MTIKENQIVKNLVPGESVKILSLKPMGSSWAVEYTGVTTNKTNRIVLSSQDIDNLEVVTREGEFSFKGEPSRFKLYSEAVRIRSAYQFDPLYAVNCSIVDPLPHQIEAVYRYLLPLPQIRFLLADDTGAGKTIMAGLIIKELLMRGIIKRILIITPGGLTKQWQEEEMGLKFNIPFNLVNRAAFRADPLIFSNNDRLVTSIDFLRSEDVLNTVSQTSWDLIVVDEAHKLSAFEYTSKRYESQRYKTIRELSTKSDHLLLLTATPHRGRKDTFRNLLQLLDPEIFATDDLVNERIQELSETGINRFFIRRLKEVMKDWDDEPLYKTRHTRTVSYELTDIEKTLYDHMTSYLTRRRMEAKQQSNIHVSLALMVMQRRLTSSIYALLRTLRNRFNALNGLLEELTRNPDLLKHRSKFEMDIDSLDEYDELDDDERDQLEAIFADPKKWKLFTTAKSPAEIREEATQVKELLDEAQSIYDSKHEEQKYRKLKELISSEGILDGEKLVIFTEHKDTLDYLKGKLDNNGYITTVIHGSMPVDARRDAQNKFARSSSEGGAQILLATDAAGEGINLQFCRYLINWDIPWNPNRLEQRMGRIHRYGQKDDVVVMNLVAGNTREGQVLETLLSKLDQIREQMGSDRVYDVISDVLEDVDLDDIIASTFGDGDSSLEEIIDDRFVLEKVQEKVEHQKTVMAHSDVDYTHARELKERSDERRLQPIYIREFFQKAFRSLGGGFVQEDEYTFRITQVPDILIRIMKNRFNASVNIQNLRFCFDKERFLHYQLREGKHIHYINPGNVLFDALIEAVINEYRDDMLSGTILIGPEEKEAGFAYLVRSTITDQRIVTGSDESIADEAISLVLNMNETYKATNPAKLINLYPPTALVTEVTPPDPVSSDEVESWSYENLSQPQLESVRERVITDTENRKAYLNKAVDNLIFDLVDEVNSLQAKVLDGDKKAEEKLTIKQQRIEELKQRRGQRIAMLDRMQELSLKPPEVIGCAYIVPLSDVQYASTFGMSRDDDAERIAMDTAMEYETTQGWDPVDVSADNLGYDIKSTGPYDRKRYIEVKGRSGDDGVMLSENEMNRLAQLGDSAWLYIVVNCKNKPELYRFNDPAHALSFEIMGKGIQYFCTRDEWREKAGK